MHNNIMTAGSKDHPPMLATRKYAQWQSRFLRYIDTRPNGDALRKCILEVDTLLNMSPENKDHYQSEKEAIHLLLNGIRDEIYSSTNLFWEFGKFTSHDGESMESYYSRFYKMMNEMYQKEFNEIRVERIAKNTNPLALVVAAQQYPDPYYQAPKSHKPYAPPSKQSSFTRSNAYTKYKGKEIAKPITPLSKSASKEDGTVQFGNQRTVTVVGTRETVDEEIDEQELEAHYSYMTKIQEVHTVDSITDTEPLEKTDQNAEECDDEHSALANLIVNLTLDTKKNKKLLKQLKKANASFTQELKKCKSNLEESNTTRDSCLIALQSKQTELETYKTLNDHTVDYDKVK
nr:hypothetical protein [Tanacetum cinerariifolium]